VRAPFRLAAILVATALLGGCASAPAARLAAPHADPAAELQAITQQLVDALAPGDQTEGGYVHGPQGVREYWTRQWAIVSPHVEPPEFRPDRRGGQSVRDGSSYERILRFRMCHCVNSRRALSISRVTPPQEQSAAVKMSAPLARQIEHALRHRHR
jgi:hypothetical protein